LSSRSFTKQWAPLAAERFQPLIEAKLLDQGRFSRVLPGCVTQFGIAGDPSLNKEWLFGKSKVLLDEPRLQANKKGTLSFASSGKNSRQTQIFINLNNNDGLPNSLDAQGFVPFARVIKGADDVVSKLYSMYGVLESTSAGMAGVVNQSKAAYSMETSI
jgi:peptidyl-prolyl cis-trans isomerase A (cyclophilin A)